MGHDEHLCDLSRIDFAKVAEGCGFKAFHLEDPADAGRVIAEAVAHKGPSLVDCWIDPDQSPFAETLKPAQAEKLAEALSRSGVGGVRKARRLLDPETLKRSPGLQSAEARLRDVASGGREA